MAGYILTIDQGTTGSRVFLINQRAEVIASAYREFRQYYPEPGWVEHDAAEIWSGVKELIAEALQKANASAADCVGIGITNQRETTLVWDRASGEPVARAIVWQCRRTAARCDSLRQQGYADLFSDRTGLVLDAYFSGTKIEWILDHHDGLRKRAAAGELAFGTIDSYLLYRLTGEHRTDFTNASRTLLFDIHKRAWDSELCKILNVPVDLLPAVQPSASLFGKTHGLQVLPDGIPVYSLVGDQQSALYGQLCHQAGEAKSTYGTGVFVVMNLGDKPLRSSHGLVTTLACDATGNPVYALEGSIFIGGALIQFLRDQLHFFSDAAASESMAREVTGHDEVVFVPAFAGLGAPYWDQHARGAIFGLTRDTTQAQITRAALKSIALQTYDVIRAMEEDAGITIPTLRVDGGAAKNQFLMEFQAGILGKTVVRPRNTETTVLGAAYLAGIASGFWSDARELASLNPPAASFAPGSLSAAQAESELTLWHKAVHRILS